MLNLNLTTHLCSPTPHFLSITPIFLECFLTENYIFRIVCKECRAEVGCKHAISKWQEVNRTIPIGGTCNPCRRQGKNVRAIEFCLNEECRCEFQTVKLMGNFCSECAKSHREVFAEHEVLQDLATAEKLFKARFKRNKVPTQTHGRGDLRLHNGGQSYNKETRCNFALTISLEEDQNLNLNPEMWKYKVVQYYDHNCEYVPIKSKTPNLNNIAMGIVLMENNLLETTHDGLTQVKMKQAIQPIIGYEPNKVALSNIKRFMLQNSPQHQSGVQRLPDLFKRVKQQDADAFVRVELDEHNRYIGNFFFYSLIILFLSTIKYLSP